MGDWGFWDTAAFTGLWVTVALSAIDQAFKILPELARRMEPASPRAKLAFRSFLAFAPLVLLTTATLILIGRAAYGVIGSQDRRPPAVTGFTQQQVDDRVKASLAPLQSDLASKITELNNVRHQLSVLQPELSSTQTELNDIQHQEQTRIGPEMAIMFGNDLGLSHTLQTIPKTYIVLTSSLDNKALRNGLENILNEARGISGGKSPLLPIGLPDYDKDLDAPRLKGSSKNGITIHGRNQAGDFLMQALGNGSCFILHQTGQTPDELLPYYNRIYPSDVHNIVWIEIGSGSVLRSPRCLNH
jgi:hypothetical protein